MPAKKTVAIVKRAGGSDDLSDSASVSSNSDDHVSPPVSQPKGGKMPPRRMGSTMSDALMPARAGPPPIEYVNQLAVDEEAILSSASERADVECFCRGLLEDLADMVQESIYASMMDRMAVPWTVQEVILELYMGMYFSVVDRDVEFPPTTTSDGRGEESFGGGVIRQENTNKTVPPVEGIAREQRALQLTQQFGSSDEYAGGPSSGSPLVGGAVSVPSPTFSTAASPDAIHPTIITTSNNNNNKANVTTDRLPSDFFCKFEPVLFGERDPGASFDGTQGRPSWAILNPRGEDVDDWSTASTEEGTSETPRGNAKVASHQQGKKKRKDMPCGFIIGQRKVSKKGKVSRSEMDSLGGRSSPTAIRRQRTLQGTATYESLVSTSRQLTPQSNSLSLSASNQAQLLHSTPDDTGRLVECLRAVSNKERVELESRRIHFEKDGQLQTSDDESQQPSPSQATVGTPAQAAPSPHQVPPQTILKRINTGKPSQPGVAVVRIMSRQASTQQAPTADASPSTTSLDPLANVRRVLSGDGDDAVPLSPTSGVISRTGSTRKSTAAVLAEKRHASSSLPDMTPTSPLFEELKPSGNPFGAADRFGSQPDTLKQSPTSPSPARGGTNQSKVTGARRLSLTAGVSSFRPTKGVRTPGKPDGSEGDSPTTTPTSVVKRLSSTAVPVPSQQEAHHPVQRPPRQRPKAATLRDPDAVSHYFYRDPLLGPQWSDVFLSVPEPPSIPPDSWSRGLLPSRRPIADELDATSLYLSSSVRGASRSGARPPGTGSGNRRSKSPGVATTSSASPIDDTARRRSSAVTPTSQSNPGSRPASRAAPSTRPGSRANGSTADGSSDAVPADSKGPTTGRPTGKKAPPKAPQQSRAPLPAEPQSVPEFDAAASSLTIDAPKNQLSLLQRLEYNDEDLQIQREEQRIKERMAALRSASEELNQQIANIKPRTPFTVDYKNAKVVVQKRPEGLRMEPVPGSICGGPTVVGGHRIATPEEADSSNRTTTSPLDQLIAEQLKLRVRAAEEKDAPKRRAQTAPSGATSPGRGEGGVGGNNGSNQVVKVLEDIEEEKRVRAELTSQLEKLDLKELKELSTTTHQEAALNATIGGMSSIGGGSPPRTRPGTALELDSAAQRRTASKKKLPPTDFFETEKRVETPMIARPLCPAGGVIARVGEVTTAAELTVPSTAPNGGRPMSRSEFNKLQQSNSTNNAEPAQATESAAYWQGELSGATRLPTKAHQQPPLPRPNSTPPTVGGTANNNSKATEVAAARGGSATPNAGAKVGLVQRLSSAVSKQAANDDSDKHAVPLGGVKGLLERARPSTTGLRSRALTPMSKQRKGIYVPPAHRIHAGEEGTSPTRAGRVATPTTIVELA